jgi:Chaperone of endosialidase
VNQARDLRNIMLGAVVAVSGLSALAAVNLTTFTPNTPIKSSEVNANFASLKDVVEAPIGASRLETTGTAADGKVLKLQAGSLAWADDLTGGAGGTAYTADGSSLALTDTTFSVKDGGIGTAKIANGAITTAKIADGAVTAAKLAFPFSTSGAFGGVGLNVTNTTASGAAIALRGQGGSGAGLAISTPVGVLGESVDGIGVIGAGTNAIGVLGRSAARGIVGTQGSLLMSCAGTYAVGGCAESSGIGVFGSSNSNAGVSGVSVSNRGVLGSSTSGTGVVGLSVTGSSGSFVGGGGGAGLCYFNGGAGWVCTSDRNKKENFQSVNAQAVLERLAQMPVTRWNMKGDRNKTPHMGPVAQDFKAAFGLGESDKTINAADAQGVALAAIKGVYEKNQALEHQVKTLEARLKALERAIASR